MKRFICWYAYQGMETEGRLEVEEPVIIEAVDMAEAMWKWHHRIFPDWGEMFYDGDFEAYRKEGNFTGWGHCCEELVSKESEEQFTKDEMIDFTKYVWYTKDLKDTKKGLIDYFEEWKILSKKNRS